MKKHMDEYVVQKWIKTILDKIIGEEHSEFTRKWEEHYNLSIPEVIL